MRSVNDISKLLSDFILNSPLNYIEELGNLTIFDAPLVAIASAEDPLFDSLRNMEAIGPQHMTPVEWMTEAKSVISYFLPFSQRVRKSNRKEIHLPSQEWLYGRIEGQTLNNMAGQFLAEKVLKIKGKALVPTLDPRFSSNDYRSSWSERHVAFIAGLGTFGLSKSLITEKGCAGRLGSVIVDIPLSPTPRPYTDIYEYCNNCGACISRCPAMAISKEGKEHPPCDHFVNHVTRELFTPRYGCGKCQTAVPCEAKIPVKVKK